MHVDTLFTQADIFNVYLGSWNIADIAILAGRILFVGDADAAGITADQVIDCAGRPVIPGMIDIHLHIESTLCTPHTFAAAVLPLGVTTVVSEPHEIANVAGLPGIEEMIRLSRDAAIDIFYGIPSSVPSTHQDLETTGGTIGIDELDLLRSRHPEIICLGEVMDYRGLIAGFDTHAAGTSDHTTLAMIRRMQLQAPLAAIEGHCPSVLDLDLARLLYLGIDSDHCLQSVETLRQRFAAGMFVEIQEKSVTPEIIDYLQEHPVDHLYSFVTDDVPPDVLIKKGHLDHIVRKALGLGLSLERAIIATSLSPARRMGLRDRGSIAPGKIADLIILEDHSPAFTLHSVYKRGVSAESLLAAQHHPSSQSSSTEPHTTLLAALHHPDTDVGPSPAPIAAPPLLSSIRVPSPTLDPNLLTVHLRGQHDTSPAQVSCRVIHKNSRTTYTEQAFRRLQVKDGCVVWQRTKTPAHGDTACGDTACGDNAPLDLVLVIDRYTGTGGYAQGFLDGNCLQGGAFCSSYAHDSHNLLLIGDSPSDMALAYEWVVARQGGMCVVSDGSLIAQLPLPIGGIMSDIPMSTLAALVDQIQSALRDLGVTHENPIMSLCTLTLPVSPELKITDKGLVDVSEGRIVDLFGM